MIDVPQFVLGRPGRLLGGAKQMAQRAQMPLSLVNFAMIGAVFYAGSATAQAIFPTVVHFYVALAVGVAGYVLFDFAVILPNEQAFNQYQSQQSARSPLKQDTEEILERVRELED